MEEGQLKKLTCNMHKSAKMLTLKVSNVYRDSFFLIYTQLPDEFSMLGYQLARDLRPARNELN